MRKLPIAFHRPESIAPGTVLYRGQASGTRYNAGVSQGIHWTRNEERAADFGAQRDGGTLTAVVIDDPNTQVIPAHVMRDSERMQRGDRFVGEGILRSGALSSEREVRLRPGAHMRVVNMQQFDPEEGFSPMTDPYEYVTIRHRGNQKYVGGIPTVGSPTPSLRVQRGSSSASRGARTTSIRKEG